MRTTLPGIILFLLCELIFGVAPARADDELPELVGSFGDPAHLVFKGNSPFTDAQMHQAVQGDLQLQVASCPSAKLVDYLSALDTRLREGFHRAGYYRPLIKVDAEPATNKIVVSLDLGERWKCGKVVVRGASTLSVAELSKRLTQPVSPPFFETVLSDDQISVSCQPGSTDSVDAQWVPGDPAPFDSYRPGELTTFVRQQLATMGYFHPFLRVSVEPADKDADLIVNLIDEGPRAILDHIEFQTLERNAPEEVRKFLKIQPGDPVDLNRIYDLQRKLWDSGRFIFHTISVQRIPGDNVRIVLRVVIKEAPDVPLLTEPLSQTDEALLRFRQWFLTAGDNGDDVVVNIHDPSFESRIVWSGARGVAGTVKLFDGKGKLADLLGDDREMGFSIADRLAGFYLPLAGLKQQSPCKSVVLKTHLSYGTDPDPDAKIPWRLSFGGDISFPSNGPDAGTPLLTVHRWFAPVVILGKARSKGWSCQINGPILTVKSDSFAMRIDAATGRLIDGSIPAPADGIGAEWSVQRGALAAMQESLQASAGTNLASSEKPIASVVSLCAQAFFHSKLIAPNAEPAQRKKLAEIAGRLFVPQQLGGLDDLLSGGGNDFYLPIDNNFSQPQGMVAMCAMWGLTANSKLFAARSWPWTVGRCTCLAICNLTDTINPELQRLYASPDAGPLADLVVAELTRSVSPQTSRMFARSGLVKLSPELFENDCHALFGGNERLTPMAMGIAQNLRDLNDDDVDAVATQLPAKSASAFRAVVAELKAHDGQVSKGDIAAALAKAWNGGVEETVETELNRLAAQ